MASRFAVIGDPVDHSKSPQLHGAAYEALGLDWSYERIVVHEHQLASFVEALDESWRGFSVTMPLKREAKTIAAWSDEGSILTGGANTLVRLTGQDEHSDGFHAYNTDIAGVENPLRLLDLTSVDSATLVGAGATAASALVALSRMGCHRISVIARDLKRTEAVETLARRLDLSFSLYSLDDIVSVPRASVTVSTIPGTARVDLSGLERSSGDVLFDIAYDVWPSMNAATWQKEGGRVISGLSMLAAQALVQVRIFVSGEPHNPLDREDKVRRAMFAAVGLDETGLRVLSVG